MKQVVLTILLVASLMCYVMAAESESDSRKTISLLDSGPTLSAFRRLIRDRERSRLQRIRDRERNRYRRLRDRLRSQAARLGIATTAAVEKTNV